MAPNNTPVARERRVALVTGAGQRLGRAIAAGIAGRGFDVAVHYHQSKEGADALVDEMRRGGGDAAAFAADLAAPDGPDMLAKAVLARFGHVDVLVNSAAVMVRTPFGETAPTEWDAIFALNARAPFFLAQALAPSMPDGSVVINIADLAAFETWPGYIPHAASKSVVVYLTRALAGVLAPRTRVNAVAPGAVLLPEGWDAAAADRLSATTPLKRLGSPDDIVQAVLYLLDADYVTGETLIVDGGRHIRR